MNWHLRTLYLHASCRDPWDGNSQYHSSANGVQPTILSGPILGGSQPDNGAACTHKNPRTHIPQLGRKPSSQDTKGDKKGMAVPERKQVNNQSGPDSKFTRHHSIRTKSYKCICLPIESGKKGMTWSFTFLPPPGTTILESWLREFSPSAGFSQFARILQVLEPVGCPRGLILARRTWGGGEIIFPLSFTVSAGLRPLFIKVPPKQLSVPKLNVLSCSHCKARLPWVRIPACLDLKFYSPDSSRWAQSCLSGPSRTRNQFCDPTPNRVSKSAPLFDPDWFPDHVWSKKPSNEARRLQEGPTDRPRSSRGGRRHELGAQQVSRRLACCSWGRGGLLRFVLLPVTNRTV